MVHIHFLLYVYNVYMFNFIRGAPDSLKWAHDEINIMNCERGLNMKCNV